MPRRPPRTRRLEDLSRRTLERAKGVLGELALVELIEGPELPGTAPTPGARGAAADAARPDRGAAGRDRGAASPDRSAADYELVADGCFLAATYHRRSERALARLGLKALTTGEPVRVLVAGLGVGHSLAAALEDQRTGEVVVVELEPKIIEWNRERFPWSAAALRDRRVAVIEGDILAYLWRLSPGGPRYDLVLADTDNGPDWLVRAANAPLYRKPGLQAISDVLAPGGVVAFWSAAPCPWFEDELAQAGFAVARRFVAPELSSAGQSKTTASLTTAPAPGFLTTAPAPARVPDVVYLARKPVAGTPPAPAGAVPAREGPAPP